MDAGDEGGVTVAGRAAVAAMDAVDVEVLLAVFKGIAGSVAHILRISGDPSKPALARMEPSRAMRTIDGRLSRTARNP